MRFLENKIPNYTKPKIAPDKNYVMDYKPTEFEQMLFDSFHELRVFIEQTIEQLQTQILDVPNAIEQAIEQLQTQILEKTSYGVVFGLVTTAQEVPDMTVNVSSGIIYMQDGERFEVEADTITVVEADVDNPRIDIVYINGTGLVNYMPGIAEVGPGAPETPLGSQLLAEMTVAANATAIESTDIRDKSKVLLTT